MNLESTRRIAPVGWALFLGVVLSMLSPIGIAAAGYVVGAASSVGADSSSVAGTSSPVAADSSAVAEDSAPKSFSLLQLDVVVDDSLGGTAEPSDLTVVYGEDRIAMRDGDVAIAETGVHFLRPRYFNRNYDLSLTCADPANGEEELHDPFHSVVAVPAGSDVTCTLTATYVAARVFIEPVLDFDYGVEIDPHSVMTELGGTTVSGAGMISLAEGTFEFSSPNTEFELVDVRCVSTTGIHDVVVSGLTVAEGEFWVCNPRYESPAGIGQLTVVNVMVNDDGGLRRAADATIEVDGTPVASGETVSLPNSVVELTLTKPASYTHEVTCVDDITGDVLVEAAVPGRTLSVDVRVSADRPTTCTAVFDDVGGHLRIVNVVKNDSGGHADPDDFFTVVEGEVLQQEEWVNVSAGTLSVSPQTIEHYSLRFIRCRNALGDVVPVDDGQLRIFNGGYVECHVVYNDMPAHVKVVTRIRTTDGRLRIVRNAPVMIDGEVAAFGRRWVPAGVHSLSMDGGDRALVDFSCMDGSGVVPAPLVGRTATIALDIGDRVRCFATFAE